MSLHREQTKIILIGIDGLRLSTALDSGQAPTLGALKDAGYFTALTMDAPTLSGPGWSTLLTGSTHAQHAVVDNTVAGHNLLRRPDLLSLAFYRDQSTTTFAAAGWRPMVDPSGVGPIIHERREQRRAKRHRVIVRDGVTQGYRRADAEVANLAAHAVTKEGYDVIFAYLDEADEAGDLCGSLGRHYLEAIGRTDAHIARLRAAVQKRAEECGERWLMVLTTDHGQLDEGGHGGASPQERASFVIAAGVGRDNPDWPDGFAPEGLVPLLLGERAAST